MDVLAGSCLCGGVRFAVTASVDHLVACHCATCKRISGGAGTVSAKVPTDSIRIVSGEELVRTYEPGEGSAKTFCSRCGSNLFGGGWPTSTHTSVRITALDEPFAGPVGSHIFVRSVAPWEVIPDDGAEHYEVRAP